MSGDPTIVGVAIDIHSTGKGGSKSPESSNDWGGSHWKLTANYRL